MRLATTFDYWKNICQGATVVTTMAMMSSAAFEVNPPYTPGVKNPWSTPPGLGWLRTASGITRRLANRKTNIARSQLRKLPLSVIAIKTIAASGTMRYLLKPKYSAASVTPMNSVLIVRKFKRKRLPTEYQPQ